MSSVGETIDRLADKVRHHLAAAEENLTSVGGAIATEPHRATAHAQVAQAYLQAIQILGAVPSGGFSEPLAKALDKIR